MRVQVLRLRGRPRELKYRRAQHESCDETVCDPRGGTE